MATHIELYVKNSSLDPVTLSFYGFLIDAFVVNPSWATPGPMPNIFLTPGQEIRTYLVVGDGSFPLTPKPIPADGVPHYFRFLTTSNVGLLGNPSIQFGATFGIYDSNVFTPCSPSIPFEIDFQSSTSRFSSGNAVTSNEFSCTQPCLVENTLVLTDKGYVNVQDLKRDDIVITHDNRRVPIKGVFCFSALSSPSTDPYLYKANCFSQNYPPIDTYLSPHHAILINNKWDVKGRSDKDLWTNGVHLKYNNFLNENIKQVKIADSFTYYHVYLPDFKTDHMVINNGLIVESLGVDYHITHTHFPDDSRVFVVDLKKKNFDI